jgi:hypothetical protein
MLVQLPIFILALLIHSGIFLTSENLDKKLRYMAGLSITFMTWPLWYSGNVLEAQTDTLNQWFNLVTLMAYAPYYLPFFSFFVYIRPKSTS